ncbi:MAG TPA: suppressor of fused domain protein [Anaerolinea thermolimosa]|uniref:Suppressor of fused domain protein n=1 Tax=Anaerolinea thermolimosa TaxID=229919 RepID=A0A3D1JEQ7_9CHLR|nr:suppressor of fused domain protein [Anaerolinea thermolimosa]GAP07443.1 suppressor of fused protein [Anaerolinea thermolimosa]HCE16238.1 suppressor of fused domain protein [Anaerolinea thermolimosa]
MKDEPINTGKTENAPASTPIYRYEPRSKPAEMVVDYPDMEKIEKHVERYVGNVGMVYHEVISDLVHLDIFLVNPSPERNFFTLVTSGMSQRPMKAPPEAEKFQYAELMICLPPYWPLNDEALKDETFYWPLRQLKILARFPHEYDTWVWYGHTIANGEPPRPFAPDTKFSGIVLALPVLSPQEFWTLEINENKTVFFLSVIPLYKDEMEMKLKKGSEDLFKRFDRQGVSELLNLKRPSVYKKWWRLF